MMPVNLQLFSMDPPTPLRVTLKRGDAVVFNDGVKADCTISSIWMQNRHLVG